MTTDFLKSEITVALDFAYSAHRNIFRKGSNFCYVPYIVHPLEVLKKLNSCGLDRASIYQAAILHDVVEDTSVSIVEIKDRFGEEVANIVSDLTFRSKDEGESSHDYQEAKSQHLYEFKHKPLSSLIVKIADRLCNIDDYLKDNSKSYAKKYYVRAGSLFQAFEDRKDEIVNEFGREECQRIDDDCKSIKKLFR
jgi:guanosine-3',5'-bis(diphosphate) 3'-pyrophosphohydrolase